ncbi:ATP-binding cassette domain-containing protein (plasmid) [Streptomyces cathayae]|uniref:ATP-binding cassette domain-containing protein n=1 Tax=Streptomyces cathayae TaxID=3031124 RepID=A0ABY8KFT0_9ACTN|nr:ATP-binding cassette domain-containing protein [Streptomyces sp. HUAS 5]WGD45253.1 ATP-binding cassette domain-containing protein [Streptomyces sp. HUAS 5]
MVAAARAADAHEFIELLPMGYDTMVGQRGRTLSGGQRQRLAIARAMIRDAPVLLLDEPTTGLDVRSGRRIMDPLRRLMAGRTTVVISHNLLTVQDATRIVVLDRGRIVECGAHDDLLERGGTYARLHWLNAPAGSPAGSPALGTVLP